MSKTVDINELELAGLTEAELEELSEFIDPDNELLPASERIPPHTRKKPTGPFDRPSLLSHLKQQADQSTVGDDYVPFVKKPARQSQQQNTKPAKSITTTKSEFDDMLDMLDPDDLTELAAELGLHGLVSQSQSRGDDDKPPPALAGTGLQKAGYSYAPPGSKYGQEDFQEVDIDESVASLESDDPLLTELNLNNHTKLDSAILDMIIVAMANNTQLTTLSMTNVRFSENHAKALADVLRTNKTLRVLNLDSNRITRKGIAALMRGIAENSETAIKELRLANQYFAGGAGAEADIAKYLEKITSIIRLGYNFTSPSVRTRIDRYMMRNTDIIRQKRASLTV